MTTPPSWESDIQKLLISFTTKNGPHNFATFKERWKENSFGYIHRGSAAQDQPMFLQQLYASCLNYFCVNANPLVKIGCIYALYLLYSTSSISERIKKRIVLSLAFWQDIEHFVQDYVVPERLFDVYQIWIKLKEDECFLYSLLPLPLPPEINMEKFGSLTRLEISEIDTVAGFDFSKVQQLENEYNALFRGVLEEEQSIMASEVFENCLDQPLNAWHKLLRYYGSKQDWAPKHSFGIPLDKPIKAESSRLALNIFEKKSQGKKGSKQGPRKTSLFNYPRTNKKKAKQEPEDQKSDSTVPEGKEED